MHALPALCASPATLVSCSVDALGRVDHDDADVRTLDREQRTHDRELLDLLVHLALFADAGGVDEGKLAVRVVYVSVYAVARRAGNVRDDDALLAQHAG